MIIKTFGAAINGVDAQTICMEISIETGVNFMLVGLPDSAVKESHYRIATALEQIGYRIPIRKIVINMAPADIRKEGSAYDLPLAIGILVASDQIKSSIDLEKVMIMGELSLDGRLQAVRGVLPMAIEARKQGFNTFILPEENSREAALVKGLNVYGISYLKDVINFLSGNYLPKLTPYEAENREESNLNDCDFSDVKGQAMAKRALEITAAGGHNVILIGPPGSGKTMLARRLPGILPPFSVEETLETTKIHSVAGKLSSADILLQRRPFRSPHHTISYVAMVGGGSNPIPGEISLAHNGVLFLDELPEFSRSTLEVLRQPLEERSISVARAKIRVEYPAGFTLVAAMNPCPCGYYNDPTHHCQCNPVQIQKYLSKISGPLLDRIDLQVEVAPVPYKELSQISTEENSKQIRKRVITARKIQHERFVNNSIYTNAQMSNRMINAYCKIDMQGSKLLEQAMSAYNLSARAYHRILKVARTIADLSETEKISADHIAEAINYRCLDRSSWGS